MNDFVLFSLCEIKNDMANICSFRKRSFSWLTIMAIDLSRQHIYYGFTVIDRSIPVHSDVCRALEIVVRSFKIIPCFFSSQIELGYCIVAEFLAYTCYIDYCRRDGSDFKSWSLLNLTFGVDFPLHEFIE